MAAAEAAAPGRAAGGASHAGGGVAGGRALPPRPARRRVAGAPLPPRARDLGEAAVLLRNRHARPGE